MPMGTLPMHLERRPVKTRGRETGSDETLFRILRPWQKSQGASFARGAGVAVPAGTDNARMIFSVGFSHFIFQKQAS